MAVHKFKKTAASLRKHSAHSIRAITHKHALLKKSKTSKLSPQGRLVKAHAMGKRGVVRTIQHGGLSTQRLELGNNGPARHAGKSRVVRSAADSKTHRIPNAKRPGVQVVQQTSSSSQNSKNGNFTGKSLVSKQAKLGGSRDLRKLNKPGSRRR